MSYPTGMLSLTLEDVDRALVGLKTWITTHVSQMAAGNTTATRILSIYTRLVETHERLTEAKAVPGIAEYAQAQKDDEALDVVAEFNGVLALIAAAQAQIAADLPTTNDWLLVSKLTATGTEAREFTAAQTASLRAALTAIADAID